MRLRLNEIRGALAAAHSALRQIGDQRGFFAMLPITPESIRALRRDHGIYMAESGRINIAGLRQDTIDRFIDCVTPLFLGGDLPSGVTAQNVAAA